jgi:SH3-like domain-containing protein
MRPIVGLALAWLFVGSAAADPAPQFVSLASNEVWGRRGPSMQHPIDWTYTQRGLPLKVLGVSGEWRRVRDPEGTETWIHARMLSSAPTFYVRAASGRGAPLKTRPKAGARTLAFLKEGIVGQIEACEGDWRKVRINHQAGWTKADALWAPQCPST